jgi:hypothetical protein
MPPSESPSRKLPECLAKLVRPKSLHEVMREGLARNSDEFETALKDLAALRAGYGLDDGEWRDLLASYATWRDQERAESAGELIPRPVKRPHLKWPARLQPPPPGSSLEDYRAYVERMRPSADKLGGSFAIGLNMLHEIVERELARQERKRRK